MAVGSLKRPSTHPQGNVLYLPNTEVQTKQMRSLRALSAPSNPNSSAMADRLGASRFWSANSSTTTDVRRTRVNVLDLSPLLLVVRWPEHEGGSEASVLVTSARTPMFLAGREQAVLIQEQTQEEQQSTKTITHVNS